MKMVFLKFSLLIAVFCLCSCIKEFHYVKKEGDGYNIALFYQISKDAVEMANDKDGGDVLADLEKDIRKEYGKSVKIDRDTKGSDYVTSVVFYTDKKSVGGIKKMLPKKNKQQLIIPLDYNSEYDAKVEQNLSYSGMSYNLMIDKELIDTIEKAELKRKNGYTKDIEFHDTDEFYLISFPLKWLYSEKPFVELIVTMKDDQQYVSDVIKNKFREYTLLQEAYFSEENRIGNLEQIGMFRNNETEYFEPYQHSLILNPFANISSELRCSESSQWTIHSILSQGKLCFEVLEPEDKKCRFSSMPCQYATAGKCGYTCPEPDMPTLQDVYTYLEKREHTTLPQCSDNEYLLWRPMEEACEYRDFPDTCVALPQHAHKVYQLTKTATKGLDRVGLVNDYSWECDKGYSRDLENVCRKWPRGSIPSKKCWISTIDVSSLKKQHPKHNKFFVEEEDALDYYCTDHSFADAEYMFRGPFSEAVSVSVGKNCEQKQNYNYKRIKLSIDETVENTALGPYSGCWECPIGTRYDSSKDECVLGR